MKYSFDEHDGKVTLPLSPPGETPRAEHWRSMLTKVGGWDNELAAVPAGGVRKLIEEFGNLEHELRQAYTMLQGSERINAELREELRRAQERCAELEGIYYAHKEYGDVYGAMSEKLEEYETLLKRWLIRFGSAGGHSTLYDETKAALVHDAAASGPKEG